MTTTSCIAGTPAAEMCAAPSFDSASKDLLGRRIYIHQDTFRDFACRGPDEAVLIFRMAARIVALKSIHHVYEDSLIFGLMPQEKAEALKQKINSAWSLNTTDTLRHLGYRPSDPKSRTDLYPVLRQDEWIASSCYFSNYYTFATGAKSAELMFEDKNDIATMRRLMQETSTYADMTLVTGNCLVYIDSQAGTGHGKANAYSQTFRSKSALPSHSLRELKKQIHLETTQALEKMLEGCIDITKLEDLRIKTNLLASLDGAFTRGILKMT